MTIKMRKHLIIEKQCPGNHLQHSGIEAVGFAQANITHIFFRKSKNEVRAALEKKNEKTDSFLKAAALLFSFFFILSSSGYWRVFHNYGAIYFSGDLDTEVISGVQEAKQLLTAPLMMPARIIDQGGCSRLQGESDLTFKGSVSSPAMSRQFTWLLLWIWPVL